MRRGGKSAKPENFDDAYRALAEDSFQGLVILQNGRVVFANRATGDLTGYSIEELLAFSPQQVADLVHPEDRSSVLEGMQRRLKGEQVPERREFRFVHRNGSVVWVQALIQLIDYRGRLAIQVACLDITEEVEARERLRRATRALRALWHCNETLQTAESEPEVLQHACDCFVKEDGYALAWIGYAQDDAVKMIRPVAEAGFEKGYLASITVRWGDDEYSQGPSGKAVREGRAFVCRDTMADPGFGPWRERAQRYGYRSSIALPLVVGERVIAVLNLYAKHPDAFDEEEEQLLERLAADLSRGVERIRQRDALDASTSKLSASESRFRTLFDEAPLGIVVVREDAVLQANEAFAKMHGYDGVGEVIGMSFLAFAAPEWREWASTMHARRLRGEVAPSRMRATAVRKDGSTFLRDVVVGSIQLPDGPAFIGFSTDVTERVRAERERDRVFEVSLDPICVAGFDGYFKQLNPAWEKTLGWTDAELLSKPYLEFVHPDDREATTHAAGRLVDGREVFSFENRYLCKDGSYRWLSWNSYPLADEQLIFAVARDVTAAKAAADAVRAGEERYRVLIEASPDAIAQADQDGHVVAANRRMAEIHGYKDPEDLVGRAAVDFFAEEERERARATMEKVLESGSMRDIAHTLVRADGTRVSAELNAAAVRDASGRPIGVVAVIRDVTERNKTRDALAESELKYREVVENASEAICVIEGGRLVFVNSATSMLTGLSSEELLVRPFVNFVHPDDRSMVLERHQARMRGEEVPSVYAFRVARGDGAIRWAEVKLVLIDWQGKPATLNLLSDITERREAELERERLLKCQLATNRITLSLGAVTDLRSTLRALHDEVRTLLDADGFFVSRYDKRAGLITALFVVDEGVERDTSTFPPIPLAPEGKGMQSQVLRTGQPLSIPNWIERERTMQTVYHITSDGSLTAPPPEGEREECTQSALLVPMILHGEPVGVLQVQSRRLNAYSDQDADLLAGLANVAAISVQNALLVEEVRRGLEGTIEAVARTTEMRDPYTAGHQERVAHLACAIAEMIGLDAERVRGLHVAGLLHDVGKMSVPAEILSKPSALSPLEFSLVKEHPNVGYGILKGIVFPWPVAETVLQHHERLDGSGYPRGLKGDAILLDARVLAVADVVEAMASHRPYRPALGIAAALNEIELHKGTHYDPEVVKACVELFRERGFSFDKADGL